MRAWLTSLLTLAPLLGLTSEARAHVGDRSTPSKCLSLLAPGASRGRG